jgi:hypothetical protein
MSVEKFINEDIQKKYDNSPYRIPLRNRDGVIVEFALVDSKSFEKVNAYKWHLAPQRYAQSRISGTNTKMHHFVFQKPKEGYVIDHINEDKLDNRLSNLREVSHSENNHNRCKRKKNATSQYKGVGYNKKTSKYSSQYSEIKLYWGSDEHQAAVLYDIYTYQLFGEHANNNRLISYEDAMKYEFPDKKQRDLPTHISMKGDYFVVRRILDNKTHRYSFKTFEEAIKKLNELNFLIKLSSIIEKKLHSLTPIQRNDDGFAFVVACDGRQIIVSDEDWHNFSRQSWYIDNYFYALNGNNKKMHKLILECEDKTKVIHHINSNTLDNRRQNLAVVSRTVNAHQKKKRSNATSKYFGVSFLNNLKKWEARITKDGKKYHLGYFEDETDAARAYNVKAAELFGKFANLNIGV